MERNVSVIIPSYNRAHVLEKTIPSYIQEVTLEVIIVDDGSADETREQVKKLHEKFGVVKYVGFKQHMGLPHAKNLGVKKASGKYIFFGDDDAVLYQGTLRRLRDAIETYPADIAGANGSYATNLWQTVNMDKYIAEQFTEPLDTDCIVDFNCGKFKYNFKVEKVTEGLYIMASFMIKAELAKKSKYDTGYIGTGAREDMDYLLRHAKKGRRMVYVPDTYEVDLPRNYTEGGGCHGMSQWKYCYYAIRNSIYFLNRHYVYLKKEGYISVTKAEAMWNYCRQYFYLLWLNLKNNI